MSSITNDWIYRIDSDAELTADALAIVMDEVTTPVIDGEVQRPDLMNFHKRDYLAALMACGPPYTPESDLAPRDGLVNRVEWLETLGTFCDGYFGERGTQFQEFSKCYDQWWSKQEKLHSV